MNKWEQYQSGDVIPYGNDVQYMLRNGELGKGHANNVDWGIRFGDASHDIVAYRIIGDEHEDL